MAWPDDVLSIILAAFLGAAVGLERELSGKSAGLRTNLLICLGAAIFTIISKRLDVVTEGSTTRIAAQILTGVGFLGAGAVIQDRRGVHGLTTAATIWLVASIGMACGAGFYDLAIISTLIVIVVLTGFLKLAKPLARYVEKHKNQSIPDDQDYTGQERMQAEENKDT
jgi:putative Mg2+ transporter-C (MgtC) family protein